MENYYKLDLWSQGTVGIQIREGTRGDNNSYLKLVSWLAKTIVHVATY